LYLFILFLDSIIKILCKFAFRFEIILKLNTSLLKLMKLTLQILELIGYLRILMMISILSQRL